MNESEARRSRTLMIFSSRPAAIDNGVGGFCLAVDVSFAGREWFWASTLLA
ncbi:hypothetical protein RchiOBHm_Chr7g0243091 [Rosa chinensis]|uniref:Uncharacterized protein n=1 Tax=Rosa chinensis TaxID=74649 RepID=A0A2P6PIM6_ROSCH|nr:hypothetical protein RchiOBHm_Chr7g0243091 [Rosa chinensis]